MSEESLVSNEMEGDRVEIELATQLQRFGNFMLDLIFIFIFSFIVYSVNLFWIGDILYSMPDLMSSIFLYMLYYVPQELFLNGQTLGKMITKTRAEMVNGEKFMIGDVMGRTLCRFIPFEPISYFFYGDKPRGWHDRITDTQVVRV